ncbi:UDP-N-acetylmuramate dehydrogenase [Neolewinella xylanilytica]|uniref:UDP-N-acetylenolpyruvoylglucosamine reductase n=1 Tax=Neolewinella xylanilytica TaxID=1514080 RepID=A0A2S6I9Z9_9BACT|nr:UDP-N-acetylmuramate dehydrogenase [Neolewinella xylanilytica]PPK88324.1 UDP-N-acetylmuramate dehydrogenase [Neolewinella xylanilytica]
MREGVNLQRYNTFGLPAIAERYLALTDVGQLSGEAFTEQPALVLGGGSNLVLLERIPGLTVHVLLSGIESTDGNGRFRVRAGTDWNQFVRYTLERGCPGMENLILIPGTVGAAPVQNIGAYGAEVAEFITAVHAWEYGKGMVELTPEDCAFGYRDSRFKREPGRFLITAVDFNLSERRPLKLEYGAIAEELERAGITDPTPRDVANAVTHIRRSKLPDWFFLGNSGSFFKNPVVERSHYGNLRETYADLPAYPIDDAYVKLPAGWLIDRAGLRGAGNERVGTYERQALVMVNRGGASGGDILAFSRHVQETVAEKFGVDLEPEVQVVGNQD